MYISSVAADNIEVFTSRVIDSNLQVQRGEDFTEIPIAEQFKTTFSGVKAVTVPVLHN